MITVSPVGRLGACCINAVTPLRTYMPRRRGAKRMLQGVELAEKQRVNAAYSAAANPLHGVPLGTAGAVFYLKAQIRLNLAPD